METTFINYIRNVLRIKDKRNKMLRNNILFSALLKVIGLSCSLLIVPVTLHYLEKETYGIWLTMSSILYWFSFFDIGLGNGMRNYLTAAISQGDYKLARSYFSTTLVMLSLIAAVLCILAVIPLFFLDLNYLFNTSIITQEELRNAMFIAIVFTLVSFVIKNIGFIFVAMQKYAMNLFLVVLGNVIALLIIFILTKTTSGNLVYVVMAFTISPVAVFFIASIPIFFLYPYLRPSLRSFDKTIAKSIISKGFGFFLIQITSCLVIFGSANIIITHAIGPSGVTIYNIAYKYFNLLAMAYTIIISPLWNAYTDAYVKNDMIWIKKSFIRSLKIWAMSIVCGLVLLLISDSFYKFWIGDKSTLVVPFSVSLCTLIFISFFNFNNCVTYLLNGLNKIKIQIFTSIITTVFFFILVVISRNKLTIEGVSLYMALCYALMGAVHFYQCKLLIEKKAKGIWNE